jgi:putative heme iron utilization protein
MHVRFGQIGAVFAVEKPSHMTGVNTLSIQFFDADGNAGMKVFLNFGGEPLPPEVHEAFVRLRERYRR